MNPIELEWQHLKKDELSGQTFEDELDLAYAVINGIQARGERGNYSTQRMKFHSEQPRQTRLETIFISQNILPSYQINRTRKYHYFHGCSL